MAKRVLVALALWALGGPVGLHHFYLGRDNHALLWLLTLGGFGVGWLAEPWCLPGWVAQANGALEPQPGRLPALSPVRFLGQVAVGTYFGLVAQLGLGSLPGFELVALPLAVALGVHLVSSVGAQTANLGHTLIAAFLTGPIFSHRSVAALPVSLVASVAAQHHRRRRPTPQPRQPLGARLYRLGLAGLAFTAPLVYGALSHTTATAGRVAEAVGTALGWLEVVPAAGRLLGRALLMPLRLLMSTEWGKSHEFVQSFHYLQQQQAYEVLGLPDGAPAEDVHRSYRELVKLWHPDRNQHRVQEAERRFIELVAAAWRLTDTHGSTPGSNGMCVPWASLSAALCTCVCTGVQIHCHQCAHTHTHTCPYTCILTNIHKYVHT
ncbi:dnaJ homolog subfamily C member 22 isoform X1 [Alligator mississippiensis]|uniref:dnaJ homolog subfamily C member 22 isoform X1 n=2 Tax=Alligator mississippiensis TaxID=8496 RepID=UPI002877F165|nr:dnaJ homolog subfamily C member 22 isoform X1 [Alligator mississippiensis]